MTTVEAPPASTEEIMAAAIAREVRDRELSVVGTLSPIPACGVRLAAATHAPRGRILILGQPDSPFLDGKEMFDLAQRGEMDLFFLSGVQIDAQANINLWAIGEDYQRPRVRLPGGAGSGMLYYWAKRVILFKPDHNRRVFVPKVDFITSAGWSPPEVKRPGGPWKVVTSLAVLKWERATRQFQLESVHPGRTAEEVQDNTGFDLAIPPDVPTTPLPTPEQLRLLRTRVLDEVTAVYPEYAAKHHLPAP